MMLMRVMMGSSIMMVYVFVKIIGLSFETL